MFSRPGKENGDLNCLRTFTPLVIRSYKLRTFLMEVGSKTHLTESYEMDPNTRVKLQSRRGQNGSRFSIVSLSSQSFLSLSFSRSQLLVKSSPEKRMRILYIAFLIPSSNALFSSLNNTLVDGVQNDSSVKVFLATNLGLCLTSAIFMVCITYSALDLKPPVFALLFQEILVIFVAAAICLTSFVAISEESFSSWCQIYESLLTGTCLFHQVTWMNITFIR